MQDIKIESGIPIPGTSGPNGAPRRHIGHEMEVGNSVFFPSGDQPRLSSAFKSVARQYQPPWQFATRKMDGGVRVWRIR